MKPFLASLMMGTAMQFSSATEVGDASIRFSNNDQLPGSLDALTTEQIVWKSPILVNPVSFLLKNVIDLTLPTTQVTGEAKHEAIITLTNGDLIRGQLASVSPDLVELDTWFAGRMKFNRLMIRDVKISERPNLIYRGPTGLDGWTQSGEKPAWIYQNSTFRSTSMGSIARNVELPDECSIAFDASWRDSFSLKLVFFSNDLATDHPPSGYEMTIQTRSIYLRNCKTQKFLGHTPNAVMLQENEKARIEVRASKKSGKVCLFIDEHIIDVWTDPDVATHEFGGGIHFISQNESPVQISRIEVAAWDGEVEQVPDPQIRGGIRQFDNPNEAMEDGEETAAPIKESPTGRMELRNGDSIVGEVISIMQNTITVKTPFREIKLPVESLRSVALAPASLERCKRENGDVRAWFPDGSSIVFRLEGVNGDSLIGYSQNFETTNFKLAAFNRIEFNIYDPKLKEIRLANGW